MNTGVSTNGSERYFIQPEKHVSIIFSYVKNSVQQWRDWGSEFTKFRRDAICPQPSKICTQKMENQHMSIG